VSMLHTAKDLKHFGEVILWAQRAGIDEYQLILYVQLGTGGTAPIRVEGERLCITAVKYHRKFVTVLFSNVLKMYFNGFLGTGNHMICIFQHFCFYCFHPAVLSAVFFESAKIHPFFYGESVRVENNFKVSLFYFAHH